MLATQMPYECAAQTLWCAAASFSSALAFCTGFSCKFLLFPSSLSIHPSSIFHPSFPLLPSFFAPISPFPLIRFLSQHSLIIPLPNSTNSLIYNLHHRVRLRGRVGGERGAG